jgi:hypothetical protein
MKRKPHRRDVYRGVKFSYAMLLLQARSSRGLPIANMFEDSRRASEAGDHLNVQQEQKRLHHQKQGRSFTVELQEMGLQHERKRVSDLKADDSAGTDRRGYLRVNLCPHFKFELVANAYSSPQTSSILRRSARMSISTHKQRWRDGNTSCGLRATFCHMPMSSNKSYWQTGVTDLPS